MISSSYSPGLHAAIEEDSPAEREKCWQSPNWRYDYRCPYCYRNLWAEYAEGGRYLVKCSPGCRIVWVWAGDWVEALNQVGFRLRPRDEWHEDYGPALWWPMSDPEEPPSYVGGDLDYPEMPEDFQWWIPCPGLSRPLSVEETR